MIYEIKKPLRMGIYHNSGRKTLSAVKKELGADFVCNLNLFDMRTFTGNCFTLADGKIVGNDGGIYPVLTWHTEDGAMHRGWSNGGSEYDHAFGCLDLIRDGKYCVSTVPSWASGKRERTAIGVKKDGTIVIYCDNTPRTIAQVANILIKSGVDYAINVDGGGSTQCIATSGSVTSTRIVHTIFWAVEREKQTSAPNVTVRYGSRGDAAKWVQEQLVRHNYKLVVDGIFGAKSVAALKAFQRGHGMIADGICGKLTRNALL